MATAPRRAISSRQARKLVEAYLDDSIAVRKFMPRLRDVPIARRLYEADPATRLVLARECGRRIAQENARPYYVTSFMWASPFKRWVQAMKQRLFPKRWGFERIIVRRKARLERLFALLLFRLPAPSAKDIEALLEVATAGLGGSVRSLAAVLAGGEHLEGLEFPLRPVYRAVVRHLRSAEPTELMDVVVRAHFVALSRGGLRLPQPTGEGALEYAEAVLAFKQLEMDFDDYRRQVDVDEVPENLRDLVPLARKWGIGDDVVRTKLMRLSTVEAQYALWHAVNHRKDEIDAWLDPVDVEEYTDSHSAFLYLREAVEEVDAPPDSSTSME